MSEVKSQVEILLLGAPGIFVDGRPLVTDTRKATALLAYLAVTGEPASRDRLADLLWPETGQKKARATLRRTLSALSTAREDGWLMVSRETVSLDMNRVYTDVAEFRLLFDATHEGALADALTDAVELYRDHFMTGFSLRDSHVFDDWQFFEEEELRQLLAVALEKLSLVRASQQKWEEATAYARRWVALDRLHEPAHRRLMEIHARAGRRSAALKQFSECKNILATELGVSPLKETIRLYDDVRQDKLPPSPEKDARRIDSIPPPTVAPKTGRGNRLFGRDEELEGLIHAYEQGCRLAVISGEAGIGKTHLAEEFVARMSSGGAAAVSVRCYESEINVAYAPLIQALDVIVSSPASRSLLDEVPHKHLIEASRLMPEISDHPSPISLDLPGARSRFFEGMSQTISSVCGGETKGIFFVDDAHYADASSLDLLAYLVRRMDAFILLTLRSQAAHPKSVFAKFRTEVLRNGGIYEISIGRLGSDAVEQMTRTNGEVSPMSSPTLSEKIYEKTEGVPLFVEEYLRAISSGNISSGEDVWIPPGGVREVVMGRLATVGEAARQVLGAAAAVGRSFDFDTVKEASGRGEEEVLDSLEELVSGAVISEVRDSSSRDATYDFSHGLFREMVYEQTSIARRRILHGRIADYLCGLSERNSRRRDTSSASIAHHYRLAGRDEEAAQNFVRAGRESKSLYANTEALSHYEAALSLGHPEEARLREKIGDLYTLGGDYEAAIRNFEASSVHAGDTARLERKLGDVYQRLGESGRAEEYYLRAMTLLKEDDVSTEKAMLHADLGLISHGRGDSAGASHHSNEALRLAQATQEPLTLARTHNFAAMIARSAGDTDKARRHLEKSLASSAGVDDPAVRIAALNNLSLALGESGETEEAISIASDALKLCEKIGDRHREAALRNNLADLYHAIGKEEESRENLRKAVEVFAGIGGEDHLRPEIWKLFEW